jgi:uronate dehydrogenase
MHRVLITGAAGRIGTALREGLRGHYPVLRLSDVTPLGQAGPGEEIMAADLSRLDEVERIVDGAEGVVHLGGSVGEHPWEKILNNNIIGTYNVFEAARRKKARRVVFASSIHFHGFYRRGQRPLSAKTLMRPDSRYGVSKVFGEAVARLYADKYGLEVVCLRIASYRPQPTKLRELGTWISPRDVSQLVRRSLDFPGVHFEILYGVSNNAVKPYEDPNAARFGYRPEDNSDDYKAEMLKTQRFEDEPEDQRMWDGAHLAAVEFEGDPSKIE